MNLRLCRHAHLRYWAATPNQHRQTNRLYRRMRFGAARRELSRSNGELFLAPGVWLPLARQLAPPRLQHRAAQWDPFLVQGRRRSVVTRESQRNYAHGWSIFGSMFGRPWTDQASSLSGALHDFDESCTRLLVSENSLGECVGTGGPA